ncbi:hypothetical protein D018_1367A, partial [Vibrio parahaemolyticus VP2007-007]
MRNWSSKEIT